MEFIAEAVHASIDLTQTDCHETVNDPSRPSLSCSSPSVPTAVDQPHPAGLDIDSYPTAFHRPENVQHPPAVFTSHNAEPPLVSKIMALYKKILLSLTCLLYYIRNIHHWNPSAT